MKINKKLIDITVNPPRVGVLLEMGHDGTDFGYVNLVWRPHGIVNFLFNKKQEIPNVIETALDNTHPEWVILKSSENGRAPEIDRRWGKDTSIHEELRLEKRRGSAVAEKANMQEREAMRITSEGIESIKGLLHNLTMPVTEQEKKKKISIMDELEGNS